MSDAPASRAQLSALLDAQSTEKYYMEYDGFFTNHLTHGVIALHSLGANQQVLQAFIESYRRRLEAVGGTTHGQQEATEEEDIAALLGKRRGFYKLLGHYQGLLGGMYGGSLDELVRGAFPGLAQGTAGSAFHGLIHTGYGLSVRHPRIVCEGLAYLHHSHLPLSLTDQAPDIRSWGQGSEDVLDVIAKVRADADLRAYVERESTVDWILQKGLGTFQNGMVALLSGKGDVIAQYVHQIKFPEWYDPASKSPEQLDALLKWLVDCIIVLYQVAEKRNEFFLLHGVTSSWALARILPVLANYDVSVDALRTQFCGLVAAYVRQGSPALHTGYLTEPDVSALTWQDIRSRVLKMPPDTDEHEIKLVQVCDVMSKVNSDTLMSDVYKRAALTAMTYPLF